MSPSTSKKVALPASRLVNQLNYRGIEDADFQRLAAEAKDSCPVSKALQGVEITLNATLS